MDMVIAEISVGSRCRTDVGDIDALAAGIREAGLLHPVVVTPDGKLIAGSRRLAACKSLGWDKVPVQVVDIEAIVHGEPDNTESTERTIQPSDLLAIFRCVQDRRNDVARARAASGIHQDAEPSAHVPDTSEKKSRERIAA